MDRSFTGMRSRARCACGSVALGRPRLEIGWALRSEFHGQGYASGNGREGLAYVKEVLAGRAVVAFTERHNIASHLVMSGSA
jgi:RimJ/RimL family protein N-acetyltransferase